MCLVIPWEFSALPGLEAEEVARRVVLRRRGRAGNAGHISWDHQQQPRTVFVCVCGHLGGPNTVLTPNVLLWVQTPGQPTAPEEGGGWAGQQGLGTRGPLKDWGCWGMLRAGPLPWEASVELEISKAGLGAL